MPTKKLASENVTSIERKSEEVAQRGRGVADRSYRRAYLGEHLAKVDIITIIIAAGFRYVPDSMGTLG